MLFRSTAEARNVDMALEWLGSLRTSERYFLRVSLNAPHTPVVVPGEFVGKVDPPPLDAGAVEHQPPYLSRALRDYQGTQRLNAGQVEKARRYYYDRVAFVDAQIGRRMERAGKDTIVALVADHGAHLGDHGLFQKQTFYEQVVTVPYVFRFPGEVRGGRRFRRPVSTLGLLPTLMDLAGLPAPRGAEAASLAESLRTGEEPPDAPVFSEIKLGYRGYRDDDRLVMVRKGRHKLFLFPDGGEPEGSLFDLEVDPWERRNLFARERAMAADLRAEIARWDRGRRNGT